MDDVSHSPTPETKGHDFLSISEFFCDWPFGVFLDSIRWAKLGKYQKSYKLLKKLESLHPGYPKRFSRQLLGALNGVFSKYNNDPYICYIHALSKVDRKEFSQLLWKAAMLSQSGHVLPVLEGAIWFLKVNDYEKTKRLCEKLLNNEALQYRAIGFDILCQSFAKELPRASALETIKRMYTRIALLNLTGSTVDHLYKGLILYWEGMETEFLSHLQTASECDNFCDGNSIGYRSLLDLSCEAGIKAAESDNSVRLDCKRLTLDTKFMLFACADAEYARKYGPGLVASAKNNGEFVHLHILAAKSDVIDIQQTLSSDNIFITYNPLSSYHNSLRREFYAFARYLLVSEVYSIYRIPIVVVDIDALILKNVDIRFKELPADILINQRNRQSLVPPWNTVAAGAVLVTTEAGAKCLQEFAKRYWDALRRRLVSFDNLWWCDQNMLYMFSREYGEILRVMPFGNSFDGCIKYVDK